MEVIYKKDEAKRAGEWGTQLTTRTLSITRGGDGVVDLSLRRIEFGKPSVNVTYVLDGPEEAVETATALLKTTGKNYQIVEVPETTVSYESGFAFGSKEYSCGQGSSRVSVYWRDITTDTIRERAANLLRIADVLAAEEQQKAEDEISKRQNEVAGHLGWGRYDSLTIAERNIIQSIIVIEDTKKEKE